jgi:hypothetical protein
MEGAVITVVRLWRTGWSFAKQNSGVKNRHGGRFLAAQGIEAEILFVREVGRYAVN